MRRPVSSSRSTLLAVLPFLAACASAGTTTSAPTPAERFLAIRDSVGAGREVTRGNQPRIHVVVRPPIGATQFVDAAFHLSEDGYAFVAVVDRDRRIRVLYPESPNDAGRVAATQPHELTRFFAGFGGTSFGSGSRYRLASYNAAFAPITRFEGGGVIVAIASDRPLQLERLSDGTGDWDESALEEYLMNGTPALGAREIGRALTLTGQEFTSDIEPIGGSRFYQGFAGFSESCLASLGFDAYGYGAYGDMAGGPYVPSRVPVATYQVGNQTIVRYLERDSCGHVTYIDIPVFQQPKPADTTTVKSVTRSALRLPDGGDASARPWSRNDGEGNAWSRASRPGLRPSDASDARGAISADRPAVRGEEQRIEPRARAHETTEHPAVRDAEPSWHARPRTEEPRAEPAPMRAPAPTPAPTPTPRPEAQPRPRQ